MNRSVLVPLDGSAFAEQALPLALSIASRAGATVNLVRVHVPYDLMYVDSMSPGSYEVDAALQERERAYLDEMIRRLTTATAVPVTSTFLEDQLVAEALNGQAVATNADFIVMTTHGHGPLSRFWLGSVADELVRRATKPVLLVRPQIAAPDLTSMPMLRHILIPLDGSPLAEQVLECATTLGSPMQADYTLVRIYGPVVGTGLDPASHAMVGGTEPSVESLQAAAQEYLDQVAERLRGQGLKVQTQVSLGQYPATAILDCAQSLGVDLIALETHGRRGLARLLLGSVADKVVRGASVPVLVHRSPSP